MGLDGSQDLGAVRVGDIENHYANAAATLAAQRSRENIGTISQPVGHFPNTLPGGLRDSPCGRTIAEHHGNRGDRHAALPRNFSDCYHVLSKVFQPHCIVLLKKNRPRFRPSFDHHPLTPLDPPRFSPWKIGPFSPIRLFLSKSTLKLLRLSPAIVGGRLSVKRST